MPIAHAQRIYQCKDTTGRLITSDRPIPECEKAPVRELGRDGLYRRDIPAPLTAEQIRQREIQEEQRKQQEVAKKEQERRDAALLNVYRTEADLEAARQRALKQLDADLVLSRTRSSNTLAQLAQLQKQLGSLGKAPPPADLARKKADLDAAYKAEVILQEDILGHITKTNHKYDHDILRFRELTQRDKH
ncbi:DUF4124 domain-containing protein [Parvibium lacunae]|nr:DUF4124 domain-containing protein [Parvibium lacunae]